MKLGVVSESRPVQSSHPSAQYGYADEPSRWNPRYWRKRVWAGIAVAIVIIIVIAVPVAVTQTRSDPYPNYVPLNYSLVETYEGESFFDNWDYFTGYDPTHGFVHYVPREHAQQLNLTYASETAAVLKVDTSVGPNDEPNASTGRFSVRVTSRNTYHEGLFIFDVRHTPYGCATWPALWLSDPYNWPDNGEIDIMEAINQADDGNQMTLHTTSGCRMNVRREQTGEGLQSNCDHAENQNAGCGVRGPEESFGPRFNDNGGGIMALEWRDAGIRMWQFARDAIPADITGGNPSPSTWGTAASDFPSTRCDVGSHFRNSSIIINITLCGDLVYAAYGDSGCPSNCTDIVSNHPEVFTQAYWELGPIQVYQAA
ncbi:family 16 glycoside hydrolase [Stachybotrys elegans]|uniref:endo-1,3(4)-beta-glucanase n=1 Tax=Stachybotrys elegans TaxID=80388 RepID=A0A8K0SRN7_9HYPO|nr:family 16 glycoside hydrolase [Stachybotrys elegans]